MLCLDDDDDDGDDNNTSGDVLDGDARGDGVTIWLVAFSFPFCYSVGIHDSNSMGWLVMIGDA